MWIGHTIARTTTRSYLSRLTTRSIWERSTSTTAGSGARSRSRCRVAVRPARSITDRALRALDDQPLAILLTVITGYASFAIAESVEASGVLAAVTAGLYIGWRSHDLFDADLRLKRLIDEGKRPGPSIHVTSPYLHATTPAPDPERCQREPRRGEQRGRIEQHADRHEEQHGERVAHRKCFGGRTQAVIGTSDRQSGDEGAKRH